MRRYRDRIDAGRALAGELTGRAAPDLLVLGLPRGGVPVAREVADALGAPLDVLVVRKIGAPGRPELALGAIASGGVLVVNGSVLHELGLARAAVERIAAHEREELARREHAYRGSRLPPALAGRPLILVDDGLATGASMRAAALAVRARRPASVTIAVPVAARTTCAALADVADDVVCVATPEPFVAVGAWYEHFTQTSDEQVRALLGRR